MVQYVKVDIVCPCGYVIRSVPTNPTSTSGVRGTSRCQACNRNIEYFIRGRDVRTNYK